jgi:RHS repeat-associated protein
MIRSQSLTADTDNDGEADSIDNRAYFYNWRGDVIDLLDGDGYTVFSYRYDAFGSTVSCLAYSGAQAAEMNEPDASNPFLFSSKRFGFDTQLSYFGARYYDASLGRFISRDPMRYIDGPNMFVYVANNPMMYIDPAGLWKRAAWNYTKDTTEHVILGDYTDKRTALGTGIQVATGFLGIDFVADLRDISANLVHWEWSWKHAGNTALNAFALLPAIGVVKHFDEVGGLLKGFTKHADEAGSFAKGTVKNSDSFAKTLPNATQGWKAGDPINNLTKQGNVPKWPTVRQRQWKNETIFNPQDYSPNNLKRMGKGLAPQRYNLELGRWESMELHHFPPQRDGGLFDFIAVWPDKHQQIDYYRRLGTR